MKFKYLLLPGILICISCTDKKETVPKTAVPRDNETTIKTAKKLPENLERWLNFYKSENPDFSEDSFSLVDSADLKYSPSQVKANFEESFDRRYEPFLVYSPDKSKYIDFDSYHWFTDDNGNPGFEADQQVSLVHLPSKTVRQISYFGPSFTIEDAYWEGDSAAVLMGNTYEKVPFYIRYNFNRNMTYTYRSTDTLKVARSYTEERLRKKGIGGK